MEWQTVKNMYEYAMKIFQDERQFTWRPYYSRRLGQSFEPEWYNMESHDIAIGGRGTPTYAYEFLAVISCTQLKGICEDGYVFSENYYPNRVARQFGFDQAIPDVADTCLASSLHENSNVRIQLFIPGITRCGNPRSEYTKWWKAYRSSYDDDCKAFEIEKAGDGYKERNKKGNNRRTQLGSDAEKSEDTSKKRKAEEISRIASTRKIMVGCRHQQVHGTSNTAITKSSVGLIYPLYSSLQLLYKRKETVEAVGISGKEDPTNLKINIDSADELVMYDVQPPEICEKEEAVSVHKEERLLVDELDKFQSLGLMIKRELSPEVDGGTDRHFEGHKDSYGQEAIDNYPQFFKLIPQNPHYKGILKGMTACEDMKRDILLGQWYMLVNLMGEALKMNGESDSRKIEGMMKKALTLEKSGFDVRHLIARLKTLPKLKHLK
ncbi:uncharacterized protein M6B38_343845 [Iris pallida]|uniref:Aminotransferase-like plant mobile domain-containing protein n=1 Tax=Iris pallida TaxID=29817 RepID=A0AAX6GUQ2_IRIPA|nr:uncharacterized protein M6B38_343845 [Iris pallida]